MNPPTRGLIKHPVRQLQARSRSKAFAAAGGMTAVDTGAVLTARAVSDLKAWGYTAAIRYLGRMNRAEADTIRNGGLDIIGVLEHWGNGGYNGYGYGAQCMQEAIDGTRNAGGPTSGIVLWIAEFDFDARDPVRAQPFINGAYDRAHANGYLAGHYAPMGLLRRVFNVDGRWQTMSTGFWENGYTSEADISQHFPYVYPGGIQCDGDDIHNSSRSGLWHGSAPAPPPVVEDDYPMLLL